MKMCTQTFCSDVGVHRMSRYRVVLARISTSGKLLTLNTKKSLELCSAVIFTSTAWPTVALITFGPSILGGKLAEIERHKLNNSLTFLLKLCNWKLEFEDRVFIADSHSSVFRFCSRNWRQCIGPSRSFELQRLYFYRFIYIWGAKKRGRMATVVKVCVTWVKTTNTVESSGSYGWPYCSCKRRLYKSCFRLKIVKLHPQLLRLKGRVTHSAS